MVVRRLAWDGRQYTRCQFLGYYGVREGTQYWEAAAAPAQVAVASQARQASKPLWQNPDALSYKDTLLVKRPNAAPPTNDGTGIQLCIKTHTSETITIFVEKKSTIRAVKELIWTEVGILPHEQRLTFQGSGEKWMECTTDLSTLRFRYSREHDDLEVLFKLTSKGRFEDVAYAARKATEKKVIMSSPEDDFQALALKAGITTNLALTTITSSNGENHLIEEFGNRFPSPSEVPIEMFPLVFVFTEPDQDIAPPQVALKTEGQPAPQEAENKALEEDDDKALLIPLHSKEQPPPQKVDDKATPVPPQSEEQPGPPEVYDKALNESLVGSWLLGDALDGFTFTIQKVSTGELNFFDQKRSCTLNYYISDNGEQWMEGTMSKGTLRFRHFHDQDVAEVFYKFHGTGKMEHSFFSLVVLLYTSTPIWHHKIVAIL